MIQWFQKNDNKKMMATIYATNITINKPGLEKISDAYAAMVGLDLDEMKIVVKPLTKTEYESKRYPQESLFTLSGGKTYTRISSTDFVTHVSEKTKLDFTTSPRKFVCDYVRVDDMLYIDLTKEVK